jgi:hypothetical protein
MASQDLAEPGLALEQSFESLHSCATPDSARRVAGDSEYDSFTEMLMLGFL